MESLVERAIFLECPVLDQYLIQSLCGNSSMTAEMAKRARLARQLSSTGVDILRCAAVDAN